MLKKITLDAMGGDFGPRVVVAASAKVLTKHKDVHLILVGKQDLLEPMVTRYASAVADRISIHHASEVVNMDESPSSALRTKKDSSMRVALELVKEGKALACVSAGNTGALMATARYVLKTLPGIDRPAIITGFPTRRKGCEVRILDLGANVDSSPEHLYQFALMGSILARAVDGVESPRVALLNIGVEEIKGNDLVKKSAELISQNSSLNYTGYIEADRIFDNEADVIVCDGFVGNIALKSIEGVIKLGKSLAKEEFRRNFFTKFLTFFSLPMVKRMVNRIDPDSHNGATFIGLNGIVIKSHGNAKINAYANAIEEAVIETEKNIPLLIKKQLGSLLKTDNTDSTPESS